VRSRGRSILPVRFRIGGSGVPSVRAGGVIRCCPLIAAFMMVRTRLEAMDLSTAVPFGMHTGHTIGKKDLSSWKSIDTWKTGPLLGPRVLSEEAGMRWVARLMTSVAAVLLTTGGVPASARDAGTPADAAWAAAVASDSLEAYAAFVMTYPDSAHARSAYSRLSGAKAASTRDNAGSEAAPLFTDDRNQSSAPGILPGMIMII
jgi:hypothetical protein